jgi:hypothetical protein
VIDTTPGAWNAATAEPDAREADRPRSALRETVRWVVLLGLTVIVPMILLSTTVAAHAEGCGGG